MSLREVPKGPLREGFTTGTSATAATKAALKALFTQQDQRKVQVTVPRGDRLLIEVQHCEYVDGVACSTVIKDGGDDPDVTHGAEIGSKVRLIKEPEVRFVRGEGVGIVTLPGLELPVGEPAINPVPRKMMRDVVHKLLHDYEYEGGVEVCVFVKNGKEIARKTLNERVGIMEGISILGTSGIVKPYSSSSYIASIEQGVDVAVANGIDTLVINSGARSEKYLKNLFQDISEQALIHYGNWIGDTLRKIADAPIKTVHLGIMLGKAVKLAQGRTDTHSCVSSWDREFVASVASDSGFYIEAEKILELNMAGRLIELIDFTQTNAFYQSLLQHCYDVCKELIPNQELNIYLIDKTGNIIKHQAL